MNPYLMSAPSGRRYLFWITLGFLLGIAFAIKFSIPSFFSRFMGYGIPVLILVSLVTHFLSLKKIPFPFSTKDIILFWLIASFFFLGVCHVYIFDNKKDHVLQASAGTPCQYDGIITGEPTLSNSGKSYGFTVKVLSYQREGSDVIPCTGSIMLYAPVKISKNLQPTDGISFNCTLTPPEDGAFDGNFSTRQYLYRQNLRFMAYTDQLTPTKAHYSPTLGDRLQGFAQSIRNSILTSIDRSFGEDTEESALLKGILLGVREDFSQEQYENFIDSGLIHITAVSGMHVMFLSAFLLYLLRKLWIPPILCNLILIPVLGLFALISALTPSVCRATTMMIMLILAQWLQREPDTLTSLSLAALILLIINPYALTSYSFILSFSSVLGIIFFCPIFYYYLRKPFQKKNPDKASARAPKPRWKKYLLEPVCSSIALTAGGTIGVGFFMMRFFRRISYGGFMSNLCLLPFSSATFVLGFINWPLVHLCPPLAKFIAHFPLRFMLWCMNQVASIFSHPIFRMETLMPPWSAILPYLVFCMALYFTLKPNSEKNT